MCKHSAERYASICSTKRKYQCIMIFTPFFLLRYEKLNQIIAKKINSSSAHSCESYQNTHISIRNFNFPFSHFSFIESFFFIYTTLLEVSFEIQVRVHCINLYKCMLCFCAWHLHFLQGITLRKTRVFYIESGVCLRKNVFSLTLLLLEVLPFFLFITYVFLFLKNLCYNKWLFPS